MLDVLKVYEKDILKEYANNDGKQLLFESPNNAEILQKINEYQENTVNPYDKLFDKLTEEVLDDEGMLEAFVSLADLKEKLAKLNKNIAKNPNSASDNDKTNRESLEIIIKISTWNLNNETQKFRATNLTAYYTELWKLKQSFDNNSKYMDEMLNTILSDTKIEAQQI